MPSDVFVAGTLRGNVTAERAAQALEGIGALKPFAASSVIRMPRPVELRSELKKSGHWEDFKIQASKGGSGRFNWEDKFFDDPKTWVPIMMSPALGNPNGNTLQEFHYQSRCIGMINAHERRGRGRGGRGGQRYERVMFTRLEFEWLAPHPPLSLLDPRFLWVPSGEDNTGVNDRHWLANRDDAEGVFRRWDALVSGAFHQIFFATSQVRPAFMSSETYNKLHLQYRKVGVARFPNVAALQCCETNYAAGSSAATRSVKCFAKACHRSACPRAPARLPTPSCAGSGARGVVLHKYVDEGHSAMVHATALAIPGARLAVAPDATPKRLHIELPLPAHGAGLERGGGRDGSRHGLLYTCKTCEGGPDVPDPVSINVTSCLFRKLPYAHPTLEAARKAHPCRYFDEAHLASVCALLGSAEVRRSAYGWWCGEVESLAAKLPMALSTERS